MKRTFGSSILVSLVLVNVVAAPRDALSDPADGKAQSAPTDAAKTEARDRFDRGLKLFNDGDNTGALAEFKRAYELIANPVVLFNLGLVYAASNRPAESADALQKVVATPGSLSADRLARAKQVLAEQAARVAEVAVESNVPAAIEIDNIEVAKTPLGAPLRVAGGSHLVGAIAPGHAPQRKEVTVAGGQKTSVKFELAVMEGTLAHITLKSRLPGADVLVDGERAGRTPLATSLTVPPGTRKIELRRPGYVSAKQELTLGDGASGEIALDPEEDKAAIAQSGGDLKLVISEPEALVTIDGKARGVYGASLRLATGVHRLVVERGGFRPLERDVTVDGGGTTTVSVVLDPTPETRQIYVNHATTTRTWSWIGVGAGVAIAGASVGLLIQNASSTRDAKAEYDLREGELQRKAEPNCNIAAGDDPELCTRIRDAALDKYQSAKSRNVLAGIGIGIGATALGLGLFGLITGDSPSKYDRKPTDQGPIARRLIPIVAFGPQFGTVGVLGTF